MVALRIGYRYPKFHHGSHSSYDDCCPPVANPKDLITLLGFIALATYFLQQLIGMSMLMMGGRRKKRSLHHMFIEGRVASLGV